MLIKLSGGDPIVPGRSNRVRHRRPTPGAEVRAKAGWPYVRRDQVSSSKPAKFASPR